MRDEVDNSVTAKPACSFTILLINHVWLAEELRGLGHTVLTCGWEHRGYSIRFERYEPLEQFLERLPPGCAPDCIVYFDDSCPPTITGLERLQIPSIFYSVDSHHHADWHKHFATFFTMTLVAQKTYVERFTSMLNAGRVEWFPLWASQFPEASTERAIDVCFRGTMNAALHPKRADFFARLGEQLVVDAKGGPFIEAYPKAKIVLNQAVLDDLNFRVFEAMACGAMLCTPENASGLTDLFTPGVDLVTYDPTRIDALVATLQQYLADEESRNRIATNGWQKVCRLHSARARAASLATHIADVVAGGVGEKQVFLTLSAATVYLHTISSYLRAGQIVGREATGLERFAEYAVRNLLDAARTTPKHPDFEPEFIAALCYLRRAKLGEWFSTLCTEAVKVLPDNETVVSAYLWSLIEEDQATLAEELAISMGADPKPFLDGLVTAMRTITDDLWTRVSAH